MVTITFEAHGTSFDNEAHISSGLFDVELSSLGKEQSKELGERYKNEQLDAIFVSELKRSYHSGEIAFLGRGIPIIKDQRLNECDYGDMTHFPSSQIEAVRSQYLEFPFPNGESYLQTNARMKNFLRDLLKNYDGKKVLIIGHRATQYGLESLVNGVELKKAVTDPWKWHPGWVYFLDKVEA